MRYAPAPFHGRRVRMLHLGSFFIFKLSAIFLAGSIRAFHFLHFICINLSMYLS
jgi:hypothetical protein